jgi:hypothetical protein
VIVRCSCVHSVGAQAGSRIDGMLAASCGRAIGGIARRATPASRQCAGRSVLQCGPEARAGCALFAGRGCWEAAIFMSVADKCSMVRHPRDAGARDGNLVSPGGVWRPLTRRWLIQPGPGNSWACLPPRPGGYLQRNQSWCSCAASGLIYWLMRRQWPECPR